MNPDSNPLKGCYILELSVSPGGARRNGYTRAHTVEDLEKVLRSQLGESFTQNLSIYGQKITVHVAHWEKEGIKGVPQYRTVQTIDINPHLVYHHDKYGDIRVDEGGPVDPIPFGEEEDEDQDLVDEDHPLLFDLDWEKIKIQLPDLTPSDTETPFIELFGTDPEQTKEDEEEYGGLVLRQEEENDFC